MSFWKKLLDFLECILIVCFILFLIVISYYLVINPKASMAVVVLFFIFAWISRVTDWF